MLEIKTAKGIEQHQVVSQKQWLVTRTKLLDAEKELTRHSDEVARLRKEMPWVQIDKEYQFDTDEGNRSLIQLFNGRSQLMIYHFMFGPEYTAACPSCSSIADSFNGFAVHLANHDVMLWAVSRAPLETLQGYKRRMGWTFPWASSYKSDFNFDFNASYTEEQQREGIEYNYRREPPMDPAVSTRPAIPTRSRQNDTANGATIAGTDLATYARERPGLSTFELEDGKGYHAYSTYSRGLDALWSMYQWLDRAPKGRNEAGQWLRLHDEYVNRPAQATTASCCTGI
jgi:predicted dithiol-disulfide oxidoreductase (DUF899 family)